jgi:hypothetical protein
VQRLIVVIHSSGVSAQVGASASQYFATISMAVSRPFGAHLRRRIDVLVRRGVSPLIGPALRRR